MMRFMDSFDHYGTNDVQALGNGQKWSYVYLSSSNSGGLALGIGQGRHQNCLRITSNNSGGVQAYLVKALDNQASWVVGFAFRIGALPTNTNGILASFWDSGTTQCELRLNTDGTLSVTRNGTAITNSLTSNTRSAGILTINTWYYIEWMITIAASISANTCKVNVNGTNTNWLNISTGQSTRNTANNTAGMFILGPCVSSMGMPPFMPMDYDDLYLCDSTGSVNNAFLGDTRIECRMPLAVGTNTDWLASGGTTLGCVSKSAPNGDISYIYSSTTNNISTFTVPATEVVPASIFAVQTIHCSRKSDAGTRQIADEIRSGGTNYQGATVNLSSSYVMFTNIFETDPATTVAWTASAINAMEIGVKQIT